MERKRRRMGRVGWLLLLKRCTGCTYSLSILVKFSCEPASFAVVPNLQKKTDTHEATSSCHRQEDDARDEHDIPVSLLQPRLVQLLKVDDLLLDFPFRLGGQILRGRHATPCFADTRERRGRDELAQEVAARLACGAEDEC